MSTKWSKTNVTNLLRNETSGRYYARIKVNGKQKWRALDTDNLAVAKLRLGDAEKEIRSNSTLQSGVEEPTTAAHWLARLTEKVESDAIRSTTLARFKVSKKALVATWPELPSRDVRRITELECKKWAKAALETGTGLKSPGTKTERKKMSASSLNKAADVLRRSLDLACEAGLIYRNPCNAIERLHVRSKRIELPSKEEFKQIAREAGDAGARQSKGAEFLIRFLASSGMRLAEAAATKWSDVDFNKGILHVPGTKTKTSHRSIPIFPSLGELLRSVPEEERTGDVCVIKSCEEAITNACERVGVKRITHHDLRHLFATTCIEAGVDIPTVSRWLGHSEGGALAMRTYGHLRNEHSDRMALLVKI